MKNKLMKKLMLVMMAAFVFCVLPATVNATQTEDTTSDNPLGYEIANFQFEIDADAEQEDMPAGFTLGDWEYNGVPVKAGFTDNSHMVCVMGKELETGNKYRFIHDPENDLFVPYFGGEVKNGYIYTIPMYEGAEVPYGFVEAYFVIQTVPMFTYMREDAELTQEEIAVGSLSEDNYLVFLMMDETGREVHYTYDLVDRTFQRALLQKKDAEKVTELNETIDKLSEEIGKLNASHAERMNNRLTIIGVLIAAVVVMAGIIVNLLLKVSKLKKGELLTEEEEEYEEEEDDEDERTLLSFFKKKTVYDDEEFEDDAEEYEEEEPVISQDDDDEIEILDLDLED